MKKTLQIFLRIVVSGGLLFLLLHRIDFVKIMTLLKGVNIPIFLLSFGAYFLLVLTSTLRWHFLLLAQDVKLPFGRTLGYYLIGFFFNNFLPAAIGGGVIRASYAGKNTNKNKESFAAMFTELVVGFIGLLIFTSVLLVFFLNGKIEKIVLLSIVVGLFLIVIFGILFFQKALMSRFKNIVEKIRFWGLAEKIKRFYNVLYSYKEKKGSLITGILFSFGVQFFLGLMVLFIGKALGFSIPLISYILYTSIVSILMMAPITINGLGIREWGFRFFFANVGLSSSEAVVLSLLFFFVGIIGSLSGAVIFPFMKLSKRR